MTPSQGLPEKIRKAGISIDDKWQPGDLGLLIHLHGVQNFQDYGFNAMHEAYCAKIAVEFILNPHRDRSSVWIAKGEGRWSAPGLSSSDRKTKRNSGCFSSLNRFGESVWVVGW